MKLAFIQAYNEANWIAYAIDQAMMSCDRLVIAEGAQWKNHPDIPERSDDGTLDIIADKRLEYRGRIKVFNTVRKHQGYRGNQCANYNQALTHCQIGDYFIYFNCDEFYLDSWLEHAKELMRYGVDTIKARALNFAFGFGWLLDIPAERIVICRKTRGLRFKPTHKPVEHGPNEGKIPGIGFHHYLWLKHLKRLIIRFEGSGRRPHLTEWLRNNWATVELKEGILYEHEADVFRLEKYNGEHPSILDSHPWRHVEDIRRIIE